MRITQRAVAQTSLQGLNRNLGDLGRIQQQLTSGKQISKPSDSPTGTNRAMQVRQDQSAAVQHARNITDAQGRLDAADTAMTSMTSQVRRVRDLTVQALNTGSTSPESAKAISAEVSALRESLLGLANSTIDGRPLFGGVTTGSTAYSAAGAYEGIGGTSGPGGVPVVPVMRRVSNSEEIRIDITGPEAFGDPAGDDLFTIVGRIAADVVGNPDALTADLTALDGAMQRLMSAAASVGARAARVENAAQVNTDLQLTLTKQLSGVEEIDLPRTIMQLQLAQNGYEAALSATSKAIQPSLVDFLR
jgi:flagellar hook-associated protein 3 FlgL